MKYILRLLWLSSVIIGCNTSSSQKENDKFFDWGSKYSQKIETLSLTEEQEDLNVLKKIIGEADVVCLGESRHDIHEQFKLKHRFVKYLVEEMKFKTFALEASLPYSNRINDYILNGKGSLDEILSNMPGWFLWDTQEMKDILNWLYEYNKGQENEDKVNFYGIDIVAPGNGIQQIFDYLQIVDTLYFEQIRTKNFARDIIEDNQWQITLQRYAQLQEEEKLVLKENYNNLYLHIKKNEISFIAKSSKNEFEWILDLAYSVNEANNMFSENDRLQMGLIRDNAMANISLRIRERNDKLIIWAHNVHIAKSEIVMDQFPKNPIRGMGYVLTQELGDNIVSIGASFNQGEFSIENRVFEPAKEHSLDGALASFEMDYFLLQLNAQIEDESVQKWLNSEVGMRGQEFEITCRPAQSFDALYFTNTISKVNYNTTTLDRLNN